MNLLILFFFFFNDTATTEIYTLSLHDALPIFAGTFPPRCRTWRQAAVRRGRGWRPRSEEHTSELQSQFHLVCRLLLEKKKQESLPTSPRFQPTHSVRPRNLSPRLHPSDT